MEFLNIFSTDRESLHPSAILDRSKERVHALGIGPDQIQRLQGQLVIVRLSSDQRRQVEQIFEGMRYTCEPGEWTEGEGAKNSYVPFPQQTASASADD